MLLCRPCIIVSVSCCSNICRVSKSSFLPTRMSVASHVSSAALLVILSWIVFVYERSLIPLYADVPTRLHLLNAVYAAATVGSVIPRSRSLRVRTGIRVVAGLLLCAAPRAGYAIAVHTSGWRDAVWGPVVVHASVLAPIVAILSYIIVEPVRNPRLILVVTDRGISDQHNESLPVASAV